MSKTLILGAGLAALLAAAAQAQPAPAARGADGRVSLAEMQARAVARFQRADLDRDGRLTAEERRADRAQHREQHREQHRAQRRERGGRHGLAGADADRDGFLSLAEMQARTAARFQRLDADRDGRLSPAELQAGRSLQRAHRRGGERAGADGVVTLAEVQARVRARFERLDVNRDGFVTRDERRAARAQRG
jgi:Ca2+-binding EF-hand superfamily protein